MTDRVNGLFVAFDKDLREDDVQNIINAILMIKNVMGVEKNVSNMDEWIAFSRLKIMALNKIIDIFKEPWDGT